MLLPPPAAPQSSCWSCATVSCLSSNFKIQVPALTPEASFRLEFGDGLSDEESLATFYKLSTGLKFIWETRIQKKQVHLNMMRSEIEAQISLLRKPRHRSCVEIMLGMMQ